MTDQNQTWETRKKEARKMIRQKSEAVNSIQSTTLNTAGYDIALNGYTIHFMKHKKYISYLGETDSKGQFN